VLLPAARKIVESEALPPYLQRRRWFAGKNRKIKSIKLVNPERIPVRPIDILLTEVEVSFADGVERYQLPLGISWDNETSSALPQQLALARIRQTRRMGYLTDAFALDSLPLGLIRALRNAAIMKINGGELRCIPTARLAAIELPENPAIQRLSSEQSNSSIIIGNKIIIKLIRRVMSGINPEVEMVRYLTEQGYTNTPPLLGEISRVSEETGSYSMVIAQEFIANQGDGWQFTLNYLDRFIEDISVTDATLEAEADQLAGYARFARAIGKRLAALHIVLAQASEDPAFSPYDATAADAELWAEDAAAQYDKALICLAKVEAPQAVYLRSQRDLVVARLKTLAQSGIGHVQTRIHGDFHLGQVLVAAGDAYIIDFEGEPAKPLEIRRRKSSPLRDVAGLLRSFHYAAASAQQKVTAVQKPEALIRFSYDMSEQFLTAYNEVRGIPILLGILDLFLIEKSAYEVCYEAANRPAWLPIPLGGLYELVNKVLADA